MTRTLILLSSAALLTACGAKPAPAATSTLVSTTAAPMAAATPATGRFEGEIRVDVKDTAKEKVPASVTFEVKGDKVGYTPAAANVHAEYDLDAQHAYAISDARKTYEDLDTKTPATPTPPPMQQTKLQKSTKEETVAGLACEDWTIDDGTERVDVCAAKGIPFFDLARDPKPGNVEPLWARALTKEKAFPLRLVVHDRAGKEAYRAEAFEVSWKKLDDSVFQVPAEFKKGDLTSDVRMASLP